MRKCIRALHINDADSVRGAGAVRICRRLLLQGALRKVEQMARRGPHQNLVLTPPYRGYSQAH